MLTEEQEVSVTRFRKYPIIANRLIEVYQDYSMMGQILKRRREIDPDAYDEWLFMNGYKRIPHFWEF